MRAYIFIMLACVLSVNAQEDVRLTDDEYSVLRKDILDNYDNRPEEAVKRADKYLIKYDAKFTLRQRLRMQYTKAYYQIAAEQFEQALATLDICKQLADEVADPNLTYYYYSYLASLFSTLENFELSANAYLSALEIAKQTSDRFMIARAQNNVGHLLILLGQYDRAYPYINAFYKVGIDNNVESFIATALNNFGELELGKNNVEKAELYFKHSLKIRVDKGLELRASWSLYNLGRVSLLKNDIAEAENYFREAIEIRLANERKIEAARAQLELVKVYFALEKFDAAYSLLQSSVQQLSNKNNLELLAQAYALLQQYYQQTNNLEKALVMANLRVSTIRELTSKRSELAIVHHLKSIELDIKEMDNLALRKENELAQQRIESNQQQAAIIIGAIAVIFIIVLYFTRSLSRKNKKLNLTIETLNKTRKDLIESEKMSAMTTLVSGMAHQLNTPVGIIVTAHSVMRDKIDLLSHKLHEKTLSQSQLEEIIEEFTDSLDLSESNSSKTAKLIQQFKKISAEIEGSELHEFELNTFIHEKLTLICSQYPNVKTYQVVGDNIVVKHYANVLLKVFEQLVKNSAENYKECSKHSQEQGDNPLVITVTITAKSQQVSIEYCDNGSGIPEEIIDKIFDPFFTTKGMQTSLGLGLNIAYNSVIHLMQGKLSCHASEKGAKFLLEIPITVKE